MNFQEILYSKERGVATITINRPPRPQCIYASDCAGDDPRPR